MTHERPVWPWVAASLAVIAILALAFKPAPLEHSQLQRPIDTLTISISVPHVPQPALTTTQTSGVLLK